MHKPALAAALLAFSIGSINPAFCESASSPQASSTFNGADVTYGKKVPPPPPTPLQKPPEPQAPAKATTTTTTTSKKKDDVVLVQVSPTTNVSTKLAWTEFANYCTLKPGQDQLPLTLTFTNGDGGPAFQALRISLSGRPLASDKDFKGTPNLTLKMDGALTTGDNQIVIQAYGPPSAKLTWKVTTPKMVATDLKPTTATLTDKVTINGKNFPERASIIQVMVGPKQAKLVTSSTKQLVITLNSDTPGGEQQVVVWAGGMQTKPLKLTVTPAPELSGMNYMQMNAFAGSQVPLTIYGKNFSTKASENEVRINNQPSPIISCTDTSITVSMPGIETQNDYVPVKVITNKVESKNELQLKIGRYPIESNQ